MTQYIRTLAAFASATVAGWLKSTIPYRHHGIGVLQGYVLESEPPAPEYRVHVWHPELRMPDMLDSGLMHDHRFDLDSTVLVGRMIHTVFVLEPSARGSHQVWNVMNARQVVGHSDAFKSKPLLELESEQRYNLGPPHTQRLGPGDSYRFLARRFHRSDVDGLTVTVCVKKNQREVPARILARVGHEPKHGFTHEPVARRVVLDILGEAHDRLVRTARAG